MRKNKFFLALYGATTIVFIELIGRLMLAEIIALINLPFINIKKLVKKYEGLKIVLSSLAVLLVALILSDIINKSTPSDFLRGWSVIIFSMISTIFFVNHLSKNPNAVIYYLFALFMVRMIFGEGDLNLAQWEIDTNYFKVRFVGFLNPAIMLIGYYLYKKDRTLFSNILFMLYGVVCIIMDARSNGLIFIISSFLLYLKTTKIKFTRARILSFSLVSIIILYMGYVFYVDQVLNNGLGGNNARTQLSLASNPYNPFELLYYGRSQIFISLEAISERPILGYGSWAKDRTGEFARFSAQLSNINYIPNDRYWIPSHSLIFTAWLYAGIVGFASVVFMLLQLFKQSIKIFAIGTKNSLYPIIIVLSVDMLWTLFFSPFGLLRTTFPVFAAIIIISYQQLKVKGNLIIANQNINNALTDPLIK